MPIAITALYTKIRRSNNKTRYFFGKIGDVLIAERPHA